MFDYEMALELLQSLSLKEREELKLNIYPSPSMVEVRDGEGPRGWFTHQAPKSDIVTISFTFDWKKNAGAIAKDVVVRSVLDRVEQNILLPLD